MYMEANIAREIEDNGWDLNNFVPEITLEGYLTVVPAHKPSSTPPPPPKEASQSGVRASSIPPPIPEEASQSGTRAYSVPLPTTEQSTSQRISDIPPAIPLKDYSSIPPAFRQCPIVLYIGTSWKNEMGEVLPSDPKGIGETLRAQNGIQNACSLASPDKKENVMYPNDLAGYITQLYNPRRSVKLTVIEPRGMDEESISRVVDLSERNNVPIIFYTDKPDKVKTWGNKGYTVRAKPTELRTLLDDAIQHYHKR